MVEKAGTRNEVAKPAVFLSPLPAPSPRSLCRPSTRPRPSRANPRWWPHYEFRLFRPSNRLRAGYTANDTGNNHLQEISVKLCIISVNVARRFGKKKAEIFLTSPFKMHDKTLSKEKVNLLTSGFVLITLYKIGELHFRLLGTIGFHDKTKSERFTAANSRCRQNLKCENFTSSFGRLRQNIAPKSVPHVQHDCFYLFNQSNH